MIFQSERGVDCDDSERCLSDPPCLRARRLGLLLVKFPLLARY